MAVGTAAAVADGLSMPLMTLVFGTLVNAFGRADAGDVVHRVSKASLKFVYLAAGSGIASFLHLVLYVISVYALNLPLPEVSCWMVTGERQAARIGSLYLKTILRQEVGKFMQLFSTFFGGFIIAFTKGWLLSLVMLSSIPPIVIAGSIMSYLISKLSNRGQAAYAEAGNVVEQTVGSVRTVVSFNGEKQAMRMYNKLIRAAYRSAVQEGATAGLGMGAVLMILFCSYGLAIWYGSKLIIEEGYSGGVVVTVMLAIMTGGMCLGQASPSVNAFAAGQAAAYKMFEAIKRKPEIDAYDMSGIMLEHIKGEIELKDVYFSYPTRPDHLIFDGFSLYLPSSTTMAIVGESGSGKSTVISLVERFYDPQAGEVLIDGTNLKKLKLRWIRGKIGLVSPEPVLFTTTIKENIMYGKENATLEEIRRASELANAANFIDKMPNGLDTMVGEHGTQLSGGQKQRIAIARAILKDPKILLLDEATSALDAESEQIVQEALNRIMLERTTIIVAHRLSTGLDTMVGEHGTQLSGGQKQRIAIARAILKDPKILLLDEATSALDAESEQIVQEALNRIMLERTTIIVAHRLSTYPDGAYSQLIHLQEIHQEAEAPSSELERLGSSISATKSMRKSESQRPSLKRSMSLGSSSRRSSRHSFTIAFGLPGSLDIQDGDSLGDGTKERELGDILGIISLTIVPVQYSLFGVAAGGRLVERIHSLSFEQVVHQEIGWFDEPPNSSGAIGARLSADASTVRSLVGDNLALLVQNSSTVITGFIIALVANWKLTLVIILVIPLVGLQAYAQIKFLKGFGAVAKVMYEEASQIASDAVGSIRTVASFCAEQRVMDTYRRKCAAPIRQGIISGLGYGFAFVMLYCTYALCFYVGAQFVHDGKATFNEVFRVFFALTMATIGVSQTSALGTDSTKAKDSAASIFAILDRKSKIDSSSDEGMILADVRGSIEFQHVMFRYPSRPDVPIFSDLCLSIPSGKTVALVGESGSGKSTVIALLERFYDPNSGRVLLDGVDIERFRVSWLRQQMGLVSQEPALFHDTIRANIAYGKQDEASEEEIVAAADEANAHQFVSGLPQGYKTVGEKGVQLSDGQKQRVAIARAIIKNPKILLLDEATSVLDAESEHAVQEALDRVMISRSTIVVAHCLSTIKGADMIAVLKNGVIVEKGRHEALMELENGVYASLAALHMNSA
ncbi:ABC transporter B family member 4 [Cocos nucifera]|uniref:ABC transporter B family member 4 n=1 Tax=Cocos nucifera TaxID=13894 RepID=A0A8K0IC10_COCNU|nr:ABC transporter B family member 4 [Cocos nucifera]